MLKVYNFKHKLNQINGIYERIKRIISSEAGLICKFIEKKIRQNNF